MIKSYVKTTIYKVGWYVGMNLNSQKKDEQWDVCLEYIGEKLRVRYQ